jgi:general secretion pathway protein C
MKSRPPFESAYIYVLMALIGFILADLGILSFRDRMIPDQAPQPSRRHVAQGPVIQDRNAYNVIVTRNFFNSDGKIPDPYGAGPGGKQQDAPPIPSQLPVVLIGTLVHADPNRSVATINLKSKSQDLPFTVGADLDGLAKITQIKRGYVEFRNSSTQRLEFIEIKKDAKLSLGLAPVKKNGEVLQTSDTDFAIKRDDINRLTSNLGDLLQQARAVPNMVDGRLDGFRVLEIQKGSIFDKLGIRLGDVIKTVNGEAIDSPAKAMELYNALRGTATQISVGVGRGGRDQNLNYQIQ